MFNYSLLKTVENIRRAAESVQNQQSMRLKMFQNDYFQGNSLYKQMADRHRDLIKEVSSPGYQAQILGNRSRLLMGAWDLKEQLKSSGVVKSAVQSWTTNQIVPKHSAVESMIRSTAGLMPSASQALEMLSQTAYLSPQSLSRLMQNWARPLSGSVQRLIDGYSPKGLLLLPLNYDPAVVTQKIERLQAFFEDLEAVKEALEERNPDIAIALLRGRLQMLVQKAQKMMRKYLRSDYPKGRKAIEAERLEAEQELLYSFITHYREVSEKSYRELMSLGNPYQWMRSEMEKTMYVSLKERGFQPGRVFIYEDPEAFFKDVDRLRDLKFNAADARESLNQLCEETEGKLIRLHSVTSQEQLIIVQGIRSGEYISEDEIKAQHDYKDWRAVRTKMRNLALAEVKQSACA